MTFFKDFNCSENPNTSSNPLNPFTLDKKTKQRQKEVTRKYQEVTENLATAISPELGELFHETHDLQNTLANLGESLSDTVQNHLDSMDLTRYMKVSVSCQNPPKLGDHLFTYRIGFTHHGIYVGNDEVIHYENGYIHYDSLDNFRKDMKIYVLPEKESPLIFSSEEVVCRAKSRLGESNYNLIINNCEDFARWCRSDEQV